MRWLQKKLDPELQFTEALIETFLTCDDPELSKKILNVLTKLLQYFADIV